MPRFVAFLLMGREVLWRTPFGSLRRTLRRQCHRGKKAFFQLSCDAPRRMQFWTLCVLFVALRVTQRFCKVSDVCLRLKAPFRPPGALL
ncbi:hypothetical protein PMA4326_016445 [Pseudomonas syringae pv. maculicola str. ES4326]|uniref:Uncharacterized protein n=1 Tax=Pseudomonas syringae pv. maculicola str. ES4326 TaxID=629265 RepID=A0A8T8C397_PSEYM|nr:hypothetical protein PMA4326_016445 [Pseudomonas syringae pv. maculicola str. ES4326]